MHISYPFKVHALNAEAQGKLTSYFSGFALAEADKLSTDVRITPIADQPIPIEALAKALPLASGFASSYMPGLASEVRKTHDDMAAAAARQAKNGGGGKQFGPFQGP